MILIHDFESRLHFLCVHPSQLQSLFYSMFQYILTFDACVLCLCICPVKNVTRNFSYIFDGSLDEYETKSYRNPVIFLANLI